MRKFLICFAIFTSCTTVSRTPKLIHSERIKAIERSCNEDNECFFIIHIDSTEYLFDQFGAVIKIK